MRKRWWMIGRIGEIARRDEGKNGTAGRSQASRAAGLLDCGV